MDPLRNMFPTLNKVYYPREKVIQENSRRLRKMVKEMIDERRLEMQNPNYKEQSDFMTLLLNDELFKDKETILVDECLTFMIAATQTTLTALATIIKHTMIDDRIRESLRKNLKEHLKHENFLNLSIGEWQEVLNYEELNQISYLT